MFLSLSYVVLRRVLQLAALRLRSTDLKELEIVVLRHELAILRVQGTVGCGDTPDAGTFHRWPQRWQMKNNRVEI